MGHKHPEETTYHLIHAVHPTTGQWYQEALDSLKGKPFGIQKAFNKDKTMVMIDCKSQKPLASYNSHLKGFEVDETDPIISYAIGKKKDYKVFNSSTGKKEDRTDTLGKPSDITGRLKDVVKMLPEWRGV